MGMDDKKALEKKIKDGMKRERREKIRQAKNEIKKEQKSFVSDFRKFISKGNVLDLAVAVVVAAAFNAIVNGLVNYIIMPITAYLTSGIVIYEWEYVLREATEETSKLSIQYGLWIKTMIDFVIIAFSVFLAVRIIRKIEKNVYLKKIKEQEAEAKKKKQAEEQAAKEAALAAEREAQAKKEREDAMFENMCEQTRLLRQLLEKANSNTTAEKTE